MKIKVTTNKYEYMGLISGTVVEAIAFPNNHALFEANGKSWTLDPTQYEVCLNSDTTIESDGGSSSYYDLIITNKEGSSLDVRTGDIIRALVGNDFDFGNCIKALRRMYLCTQGKGKQGTNLSYDANKVRYFVDEIENLFGNKD